jgi:hypothetical protein
VKILLAITRRNVAKVEVWMKLIWSNLITINTRNPETLNDEASDNGYKGRRLEIRLLPEEGSKHREGRM